MKKGRCGTMTHDYQRHGTTTLFAALAGRYQSLPRRAQPRPTTFQMYQKPEEIIAAVRRGFQVLDSIY
jgi:hypothetical protein